MCRTLYDVKKTLEVKNMLLGFKFKNVLSFKELADFSMVAGKVIRKKERVSKKRNFSILKFSAIYGANASGKSNLISAMSIMRNLVLFGPPKPAKDLYYKLDSNCKNEESYFEVNINSGGKNYSYGFTFDFAKNIYLSEWLYQLTVGEDKKIFERDILNNLFLFDNDFTGDIKTKFDVYQDDMKGDTKQLFLTFLLSKLSLIESLEKNKNIDALVKILIWFVNDLDITTPNSALTSSEYFIFNEKLNELSQLLAAFDTGIKHIECKKIDENHIGDYISESKLNEIKERMANREYSGRITLVRYKGKFLLIKYDKEEFTYKKITFYHDRENKIEFNISEESEGTIRLLDLAEILLSKEKDKVYVIDELDRCLHPQITMKFVELFLKKAENEKNNNQLIVTTHESRLLDFDILRRDEVWFVNKVNGKSSLYSLEEYNERFDKKIDKAYLDGRYGGVPIFNTVFPIEDN